MLAMEATPEGNATDLGPALERISQMLTKRGLVVLISDLLTSIERLESDLGYLCAAGHDVVMFNILDPTELTFEFDSPALFRDVESGRNRYVDPESARAEYKRKMTDHFDRVETVCRNLGIDYHQFATDRPFDLALLDFLQGRMHRRKLVRRKGGSISGGGV